MNRQNEKRNRRDNAKARKLERRAQRAAKAQTFAFFGGLV